MVGPIEKKRIILFFLYVALFFLLHTASARADRIYEFSQSVTYTQIFDDNSAFFQKKGAVPSENIFPSWKLVSQGPRSIWTVNYSTGAQVFNLSPRVKTFTHEASLSANYDVSEKLSFRFSDHFSRAPIFSPSLFLRGLSFSPAGLSLDYGILLESVKRTSNRFSLGANYRLDPDSSLDLSYDISADKFPSNAFTNLRLVNYVSRGFKMAYSHRQTDRLNLSVSYSHNRLSFSRFHDSTLNVVAVGGRYELSPSSSLSFDLGPTLIRENLASAGHRIFGVTGGVTYSKQSDTSSLSLSYNISTGGSGGLAGAARNQIVSATYHKQLSRNLSWGAGLSYLRSGTLFEHAVRINRYGAYTGFNYALSRSITLFVAYNRYLQRGFRFQGIDLNRTSLVLGITYTLPTFSRGVK